jgi:plasmid stabilization system protein ParE
MKVRWSETALSEIDDIFSYIFQRNQSAATLVTRRVEDLVNLLGEFPLLGHVTDEAEVRILSVVRYPFVIFYTINNATQEVVILHVRHTAQDQP